MTYLATVPFFLTILLLACYNDREVYAYFYIPLWLLIPSYYYLNIKLLPDFNFTHFASIPLFGFWIGRGLLKHRFSFLDLIVVLYCAWSVFAEWEIAGDKDGINMLVDRIVMVAIPYLLAKYYFRFPELRIKILKVMVVIGAAITIPSLFEFRYGLAIIDPLHYVWPYQSRWTGISRLGVVRVAATFLHPIISALMWAIFTIFNIYLIKIRAFQKQRNAFIALFLNLGGLFMGISRGPLLGWFFGLITLGIGWSKWRLRWSIFAFAVTVVSAYPLGLYVYRYVSISRWEATTEFQETAAYRWELLENYAEFVGDRLVFGYGRVDFPVFGGQASIDNQYLYLALLHGVPVASIFALFFVWTTLRTFFRSWQWPSDHPFNQLSWVLNACLITMFFTLLTVWLGGQSEQMLFILLAFADMLGYELKEPKVLPETYYTYKRLA